MRGYNITELSSKIQQLIKQNNLDINNDGKINEDNGELAKLLSQTGKKDINELLYNSWWEAKSRDVLFGTAIGTTVAGAGIADYFAFKPNDSFSDIKKNALKRFIAMNPDRPTPVSENVPRTIISHNEKAMEQLKKLDTLTDGNLYQLAIEKGNNLQIKFDSERELEIARRKAHNQKCADWKPKYTMRDALNDVKKGIKKARALQTLGITFTLVGICLATYFALRKPQKSIQMQECPTSSIITTNQPKNEWEEKYTEAFGADKQLIEYTPQKGEYWISILKAKYGVDDITAQKMANKIKEMIYGDAKAAKQTPIMYLPQTWNFEGNTYNYNEDAIPEKTIDYSDNVKTEQGKMTKELEY